MPEAQMILFTFLCLTYYQPIDSNTGTVVSSWVFLFIYFFVRKSIFKQSKAGLNSRVFLLDCACNNWITYYSTIKSTMKYVKRDCIFFSFKSTNKELNVFRYKNVLCIYPTLLLRAGCDTRSIFNELQLVWIQSLPSLRLVAVSKLKSSVYPTIYP